ncbi:MAG: HAD family phosphatase [Patescibacteria group bacterium]|nr:HAD family phosphatase [Patescibacteria group bacterium]
MIKAVIFDFGGVILNMKPLLAQTKKIFQMSDDAKLWETINIEALPLSKGEITLLQCFRNVTKKLKKNIISEESLKDLWIKDYGKFTSIDKNIKKLIALLKKNYQLAIVSNTIKEHTKINKKLGRFKLFDVVILSHEVGLTKDEKEIFLLAAKSLDVKPEECVFIDDIKRFLKVAEGLGMKTIHFKNPTQLRKDLKALGLLF